MTIPGIGGRALPPPTQITKAVCGWPWPPLLRSVTTSLPQEKEVVLVVLGSGRRACEGMPRSDSRKVNLGERGATRLRAGSFLIANISFCRWLAGFVGGYIDYSDMSRLHPSHVCDVFHIFLNLAEGRPRPYGRPLYPSLGRDELDRGEVGRHLPDLNFIHPLSKGKSPGFELDQKPTGADT